MRLIKNMDIKLVFQLFEFQYFHFKFTEICDIIT
jgi:hypothetical protein